MKERDVGSSFAAIFKNYLILSPKSFAEPGWPDRLIVMPDARVIACELKRVRLTLDGRFSLKELRNDQTAFLAKWQRAGGLCFVLAGLYSSVSIRKNAYSKLVSLAPISVPHWKDWLDTNKQEFLFSEMFSSIENDDIYKWFLNYISGVYAQQRQELVNA